jgi:hypothetical protein
MASRAAPKPLKSEGTLVRLPIFYVAETVTDYIIKIIAKAFKAKTAQDNSKNSL